MKAISLLLTGFLLCNLVACSKEDTKKTNKSVRQPGCRACHTDLRLDDRHNFACTNCHQGDNSAREKTIAHNGLLAHPAAPDSMTQICGTCHAQQIANCDQSKHFTF